MTLRKLFFIARRQVHSKPLLPNKKIAVVGGGPGGLTLARLLQMNGADVKVYERSVHRNARQQGYTVNLQEGTGLLAMETAGLLEQFKTNCRPGAEKVSVLDRKGNVLMDNHSNNEIEGEGPAGPEIDQGPLQDILLDSLNPDTVIWNSRVIGLKPDGKGWMIEFENGSSSFGDLVIAADGANSKLRQYVTDLKPFYSGVTMVEGTVADVATTAPDMAGLLQGGKVFILGNELSLVISSTGDGSLIFWTGMKCDENWAKESGIDFSDKQQVLKWFKTTYQNWSEALEELFTRATPPFIPRPQYCMALDQGWASKPNITLIGDAAHVMPPYAGEGVNIALTDALDFFRSLQEEQDIPTAISKYEPKMLRRAQESVNTTMNCIEAIHSPEGSEFVISALRGQEGGQEGENLDDDIEQAHLSSLDQPR